MVFLSQLQFGLFTCSNDLNYLHAWEIYRIQTFAFLKSRFFPWIKFTPWTRIEKKSIFENKKQTIQLPISYEHMSDPNISDVDKLYDILSYLAPQ